ncbi:MAG: thioredoxin family protein [Candidatus Methanoperedens sp.]|nr:thioredoxin family protein [Candidatus Methanoperedens sp.]
MKKYIFIPIIIFVLISGCLSVQSDNSSKKDTGSINEEYGKITLQGLTFNTQVQPVLEAAIEQGKPIFIYARSQVCGWCKKFEAETFTNETVIKTLNENFILLTIDVYEQKSESVNLRVRGTPTEIFLNEKGIEIKRIPGYIETQPFLDTINEIIKL